MSHEAHAGGTQEFRRTASSIVGEALGCPSLVKNLASNFVDVATTPRTTFVCGSRIAERELLPSASAEAGDRAVQRNAKDGLKHYDFIQGRGALLVLADTEELEAFPVLAASENTSQVLGISAGDLMALECFSKVLTDEAISDLADRIDCIRALDNKTRQGPEVFELEIFPAAERARKLWCALHLNVNDLVVLEFESKEESCCPLSPLHTPQSKQYYDHDYFDYNEHSTRPSGLQGRFGQTLKINQRWRRQQLPDPAMGALGFMAHTQGRLAAAADLEHLCSSLANEIKAFTGYQRVIVYHYDTDSSIRILGDAMMPDLDDSPSLDFLEHRMQVLRSDNGYHIHAHDTPAVSILSRENGRPPEVIDLSNSYLRTPSLVQLQHLLHVAAHSSIMIPIFVTDRPWGAMSCYSYDDLGKPITFPVRSVCGFLCDIAAHNIRRIQDESSVRAWSRIDTVLAMPKRSDVPAASSRDLLWLFGAEYGVLSIATQTRIIGQLEQSQAVLFIIKWLRKKGIATVTASTDIEHDYPELLYPPGFAGIIGMLVIPLSQNPAIFFAFFRSKKSNPDHNTCDTWTDEQMATANVLCLISEHFTEPSKHNELDRLTKLLLENSAHELRTPLNAVMNYLEVAMEMPLDLETKDTLKQSQAASRTLLDPIRSLIDMCQTTILYSPRDLE